MMCRFYAYVVIYIFISSIAHCHVNPTIVRFKLDLINNEINTKHADGRRRLNNPISATKSSLRIKNQYPIIINSGSNIRVSNTSDIRNYPYMAAIIINGRLWCAGTIVDVNWVVTAAHCLNYVLQVSPSKSLQKYVKVRVGSVKPHEGGQVVGVAGAVRHPKFEEEPVPHADIALIKLAQDLVFNQFVNLIKIYEDVKEPYAQSFVVVTGWGATRGSETTFREHTPDMMSARLKVRTRSYCQDAYQLVNGFQFTSDFFCASLRNGTRDACLFDAGAPAIQQNRLMGVMSFGPERCGHEFQPAVFIKAFYFRDFVRTTIASYKTTADLIEAMHIIDPEELSLPTEMSEPTLHSITTHSVEMEEFTTPDSKRDK